MRIVTVVGARPQFIKAAALSRVLRKEHQEILVHTGQHYDANMSQVFFDEMDIPAPDYNLGISGGSHARMTGNMMIAIEEVLIKEKPDMLLVYGDTNSTLATALAAVKLRIPIAHVEAGNRLGTKDNPEEINRICTDHVSSLRFACVESAMRFLRLEGLGKGSYLVGDPMYDALLYYSARQREVMRLQGFDGDVELPREFYYLTCHREENTRDAENMRSILAAMQELDAPAIYPLHPRNREKALMLKDYMKLNNVIMIPAVGYLESIYLVNHAKKVITDSGGVQREAFFAGKQCVTVFDYVVWPETMINGCNRLAKPDKADILDKLSQPVEWQENYQPFGDGHSAEKICAHLKAWEEKRR